MIEEMKKEGLQPTRVTFNELTNAMIDKGSAQGRAYVWGIVAERQEADVKPNRVTCSILLKCLDAISKEQTPHGPWTSSAAWMSPWIRCCSHPSLKLMLEGCGSSGRSDAP